MTGEDAIDATLAKLQASVDKGAVKLIQNASGRSVMVEMAGKPADDNALPYPDPNPSPSN